MKPIVFLLLHAFLISVGTAQIVNTKYGPVEGTSTLLSRTGREISAFLGIPYAKPSLGDLRFKAPQPPESWTEVRDASSYGPICPQYVNNFTVPISDGTNFTGDENCLTINVFVNTKNLPGSKKRDLLPVLFYIHGGFFMMGSSFQYYGPKYLLDHNLILVTFQYRIGVLGFLAVPDGDENNAPGNAGMKDQIFALKWVQENIHNFGGNASRVTIYGESAGGAAVQYLLSSNQSEGLFHAAMSASGSSIKVLSLQFSPVKAAEKLADEVGCGDSIGNTAEMLTCLRSINASDIAAISDEQLKVVKDPLRMFAPSQEINDNPENAFITKHPYEILTDGLQHRIPWMIGVNSGEGFITTLGAYESEEWTNEINNNWNNGLAPKILIYNESDIELTNSINEFYLNSSGDNDPIDFRRDFLAFTNILSDRLYIHASVEAARIQSKYSPVYLYYNDYITNVNPFGLAFHGEELPLVFSPANFTDPMIEQGHPDYEQSLAMVDLWVQFIKDPHSVYYNGRLWNPVSPSEESPSCLVFKNSNRGEQGVTKLPDEIMTRLNFWNTHGVPPYQESEL